MWTESLEDTLTDRQTGILYSPWGMQTMLFKKGYIQQNWSQVRLVNMLQGV